MANSILTASPQRYSSGFYVASPMYPPRVNCSSSSGKHRSNMPGFDVQFMDKINKCNFNYLSFLKTCLGEKDREM